MRTVTTILVIFLAQCTYLYAEPKLEIGNPDSCTKGVKSIKVFRDNSRKNIAINEICDNIDSSKRVVFVVHGFLSSANASTFQELSRNLVQKGFIVFIVDWSQAACTEDPPIVKYVEYPWAVKNTPKMGHFMATYIIALIKCGVPIKNIILIGHSLGAHICGFAAKEVAKYNNEKILYIIALDPANPLFSDKECKARLCKSDAIYVVIFHTSLTFGMWYPMGYCDFFFNNGRMQPGCDILKISSCSHTRSVEYLSVIIKYIHCGFPAFPKTYVEYPWAMKNTRDTGHFMAKYSPSYPNSDTKFCFILNYYRMFEINPTKGNFSVDVEDKNPFCTYETSKCSNNSKSLNLKH